MKRKRSKQLELMKSIRKPVPPATKVERPDKGGGYKRRKKHQKDDTFNMNAAIHDEYLD